jgi:hypothetical protein
VNTTILRIKALLDKKERTEASWRAYNSLLRTELFDEFLTLQGEVVRMVESGFYDDTKVARWAGICEEIEERLDV